jgi:hypothetical protein
MSSYDVVVIGDANFHYIRNLIEEVLDLPSSSSTEKRDQSEAGSGLGISGLGNRLGLVKRGLGMFLGGGNDNSAPHPTYNQPVHPAHTGVAPQGQPGFQQSQGQAYPHQMHYNNLGQSQPPERSFVDYNKFT